MMKGAALARLSLPHKVALSGFLILALVHVLGVSAAMAWLHSGMTSASIATHYRGNEDNPSVPVESLHSPKSTLELVTLTHYHMAVMPVFAFIICHILAVASWPGERIKIAIIILSYLAIVTEVSVPWLSVVAPQLVWVRHFSRAGIVLMTLVGAGVPLMEMWGRARPEQRIAP